jgi:hypothetical protein
MTDGRTNRGNIMTRNIFAASLTATVFVFFALTGAAYAAGPKDLEGTWTLDIDKSKFGTDPPMKSDKFVVTQKAVGLWLTTLDWVDSDGSTAHLEYVSAYDGKRVPITGSPAADAVKVTFNAPEMSVVFYKGAKRVQWGHFKLSADGKTLEGPLDGVEPDGTKWNYLFVWSRR